MRKIKNQADLKNYTHYAFANVSDGFLLIFSICRFSQGRVYFLYKNSMICQNLQLLFMKVLCCLVIVLVCASSKRYLKNDTLQMSNLYSLDIASEDMKSYYKVDTTAWSSIISSYPIIPNATTIVDFYFENGYNLLIGCGKKNQALLKTQYPGKIPNTVGYYSGNGEKYNFDNREDYGPVFREGDNITMIINMHEDKEFVKFKKNGNNLGIAYSGLGDWGDQIYIIAALHNVGHRFKITNYTVIY